MDPEDYGYEGESPDDGDTKPHHDANPFISGIKLIRLSENGIGSSMTVLLKTNERIQDVIARFAGTGWRPVDAAPPNFEPAGNDDYDMPESVFVPPEWRATRWFPDWVDHAPPVEP